MKRTSWGILVCLAMAGGLLAQEVPEPVDQTGDDAFFLFGAGEYRYLGESLYLGALYVPLLDVRIRPDSPKYMEMRITTETLSSRRFVRHWMDGLTLSSSRQERLKYADAIRTFGSLFAMTFRRGDRIRFAYQPDQSGIVVSVNAVEAGTIDDIGFFTFLLGAWIGDTPVSAGLRDDILGTDDDRARKMKQAFQSLQYSDERHREVLSSLDSAAIEARSGGAQSSDRQASASGEASSPTLDQSGQLAAELEAARQQAARLETERLEREAREEAEARRLAEARRERQEQQQLGSEYRDRLVSWIRQFAEYPRRAMERRHEGRIEMSITSDRQGQITDSAILEASGSYLLDNAAIDMLEKAEPLPLMPEHLEGESFTFIMPISFAL